MNIEKIEVINKNKKNNFSNFSFKKSFSNWYNGTYPYLTFFEELSDLLKEIYLTVFFSKLILTVNLLFKTLLYSKNTRQPFKKFFNLKKIPLKMFLSMFSLIFFESVIFSLLFSKAGFKTDLEQFIIRFILLAICYQNKDQKISFFLFFFIFFIFIIIEKIVLFLIIEKQ